MATSAIHFYQSAATRRALASIFKTVEELDRNHKRQVAYIFDETDFRIDRKRRLARLLNVLKTYSVCEAQGYIGVCFLSVGNIVKEYAKRYEKISERCVQGLLADLRALDLIQRIETKRRTDNRQSTNIYRTKKMPEPAPGQTTEQAADEAHDRDDLQANERQKPVDGADKSVDNSTDVPVAESCQRKPAPKATANMHPKKAHFFSKAQLKVLRKRNAPATSSIVEAVSQDGKAMQQAKLLNFVPEKFKQVFSAITTVPREVYEFWRVTRHCVKGRNFDEQTVVMTYRSAFKRFFDCCKAAVKGKFTMHNPYGFYHAIMSEEARGAFYGSSTRAEEIRQMLEGGSGEAD